MIAHGYTDRASLFEKFKMTEGAIWASPSSARGIDLPDDLCEFIIWLKAPFLNLRDPQVSERVNGSGKFGKLWYASNAAQTIIQGCGRGFRHPDDACTVYLLDENIDRLLNQKKPNLFPNWFQGLVSYATQEEIDEGWD
jgi:Rad3-related DNA helicase